MGKFTSLFSCIKKQPINVDPEIKPFFDPPLQTQRHLKVLQLVREMKPTKVMF